MTEDANDPAPRSSVLHVGEHDIRLHLSEGWPSIGKIPYLIAALTCAWFTYVGTLPDVVTRAWLTGLIASATIGLIGLLWALRTRKTSRIMVLSAEELRLETRIGDAIQDQRIVPILQIDQAGVEWLGRPNQYALRVIVDGAQLAFSDVFFKQETIEWMARRIMATKQAKIESTRSVMPERRRPDHINELLMPGTSLRK